MTNYRYLISLLFAVPSIALSAEKTSSSPYDTSTMAIQVVLALAIVTASIFALAWVAKRLGNTHLLHNQKMKLISTMALGTKEKMVLVEVEGQKLLLGVTPNNIASLHVFPSEGAQNNAERLENDNQIESDVSGFSNHTPAGQLPEKWDFARYFKKIIRDGGEENSNEVKHENTNEGGKG
ncbi:MAG: flagellar biosynthetic protein FliO [Agarilytica sp.]